MNCLRYIAIIIFFTTMLFAYSQNLIGFAYDEAGNRIKRELIIPAKPQYFKEQKCRSCYDELGGRSIKITTHKSGIIDISISNLEITDNACVDVFSVSGMHILSQDITEILTSIDIGSQPSGIYIVSITVNGNVTNWKVIKN